MLNKTKQEIYDYVSKNGRTKKYIMDFYKEMYDLLVKYSNVKKSIVPGIYRFSALQLTSELYFILTTECHEQVEYLDVLVVVDWICSYIKELLMGLFPKDQFGQIFTDDYGYMMFYLGTNEVHEGMMLLAPARIAFETQNIFCDKGLDAAIRYFGRGER